MNGTVLFELLGECTPQQEGVEKAKALNSG